MKRVRHAVEEELSRILQRYHNTPGPLATKIIEQCMSAAHHLGGISQLTATTLAAHASEMRQQEKSREPLTAEAAAAAVLHGMIAFRLLQLKFASPDSRAEELCRSSAASSGAARARARAEAALDAEAINTLRRHGCVVRPHFLSVDDARALHAEFFALANEDRACSMDPSGALKPGATAPNAAARSGCQYFGPSVFEASRSATANNAAGREFVVARAEDARMLGAPVIASTLEAIYALADGLGAAAAARAGRGLSPVWWARDVLAPSRGMLQRYSPGARYDEHTDTDYMGDGWVAARAFTAIVYAHAGWAPGDGGELHVQPLEYEPTAPNPRAAGANTRFQGGAPQDGERTVVPPRGGTLVLFPSHLYHRVAAVTRASARYAVTAWLSLPERAEALGAGGSLAAELTSSGWVSASADHSRMLGGGATTAGRPLPGCAAAKSAVEGAQRRAMHALLA